MHTNDYTTRGHNLRFLNKVIFLQYETFKIEVIVILHQEFKSFIMLKRTSSKPQIMPVSGIVPRPLKCPLKCPLECPIINTLLSQLEDECFF